MSCAALHRDGESHNLTWNCGAEGETAKQNVLRLRQRQMRNLAAALLLSHGVPMIHMGDEYGHSKVCKSRAHSLCDDPLVCRGLKVCLVWSHTCSRTCTQCIVRPTLHVQLALSYHCRSQ